MPRTVSSRTKAIVRKQAEAQFSCTVRIWTPAPASFDAASGQYTSNEGAEKYRGAARIWSVQANGVLSVGEGDLAMQATYCSIPWNHTPIPDVDDWVEMLSSDDTDLPGRTWRVIGVDGGGLMRATRRLQITGMTENRSWRPE